MSVIVVLLGLLAAVVGAPPPPHSFSSKQLGIVGGNDTDISQHPWQVSLQRHNDEWCSAFLISPEWLLTSAYCIHFFTEAEIPSLYIRAGSTELHKGGQLIPLQKRIVHPKFNKYWYINDIALLHLAVNVTDPVAQAVNLPEADQELPDGTTVSVAGWGGTDIHGGDDSIVLQEVQMPTVNRNLCQEHSISEIPDYAFCAGLIETGGKGVCLADGGGPATVGDVAVGIVSYADSCGNKGALAVFTEISKFRDWIRENSGI